MNIDLSCLSSAEMISSYVKILPLRLKTSKQELHLRLCLILLEMFGGRNQTKRKSVLKNDVSSPEERRRILVSANYLRASGV